MAWPVMKALASDARNSGAAQIFGQHVALDHAGIERVRADLLHHDGVIEHALAGREAGNDRVHPDFVGGEFVRHRARHGKDRAL